MYIEGSLQTRKWTDQQGQEKYTTEVVIDRFRGELTLLDSKGAGDEAGGGFGESGGFQPRASAPRERAPAGAGRGGNPSWDAPRGGGDLDDEIPF